MRHVNVPDHGELIGLADDDHTQYILATGSRAGASASRQAFTNGITTETIRPVSDNATAIQFQSTLGVSALTIDTTKDIVQANRSTNDTNLFLADGGNSSVTGSNNVALGKNASGQITTAASTVALGTNAASSNTTGSQYFALGTSSGFSNTIGSDWVAIGTNAGYSSTTLGNWVAIGTNAGRSNLLHRWVCIGDQAGRNSTKFGVVCIGFQAGYNNTSQTGINIGYQSGYNETADNKLHIANNATLSLIEGTMGSTAAAQSLKINASTVDILAADAATNAIVDTLLIRRDSTGTPAANFGSSIYAQLGSSTTAAQAAGRITWKWATATHASRASQADFTTFYTSTERTSLSIGSNASGPLLGFYGATPAVKPDITGSRAGNAALADLLTQLATIGLITDSTT